MNSCFVELDLRQAEWVTTAFISGDLNMLDAVASGDDIHVRTGILISGAPRAIVEEEHKLVGHLTDESDIVAARASLSNLEPTWIFPRTMSVRQMGKKSNHGFNYGMYADKFALINEVSEAEGARVWSAYHAAYPGLKQWYSRIDYELRTNGRRLTNCFGQSRRFMGEWNRDLLMAAYAFKPQSSVANVALKGWQLIHHDPDLHDKVAVAAQVHDSVLTTNHFETEEELWAQIDRERDHMQDMPLEYDGRIFTLGVDVKIGVSWGGDCMIEVKGYADIAGALEASRAAQAERLSANVQ